MTNTNKKIIEGIRFIARDTQKVKIFDKIGYIRGYSAVDDLLEDVRRYQERYEHEFDICGSACIEYGKIDMIDYDDGNFGTFTTKEDEE